MLNIDQCILANRPCLFVVCESDIEVLKYLDDKYNNSNSYHVYSSTLAQMVPLKALLSRKFLGPRDKKQTTLEVLDVILNHTVKKATFETFIFLDADGYVGEKQALRKIKDILTRYQLDMDFTVSLIFISQSICVPPALQRLSEVVFFDLPDETRLKDTSNKIADLLELNGDDRPSAEIVNNLKGLTVFEVEQAYLQSWQIHQKIDLTFIRDFKKSALSKTDLLSLMESNVTFDDIGGMDTLKSWINKSYGGWTVEGKEFGLPFLKGLLMVGLPGCGKSLICKALGNQWGLPVISFDPSRVFSSRVGDSESNIRRALALVENIAPCILFIDEIEKGFAGSQSSTFSDSGVTARVIGTFLIWLQDCQKPVFTVATSNNIRYLPPELIQRFDETFFVNLPQEQEREIIFKIHVEKLKRDPKKFDFPALAVASSDLSGREIEQVLRESMYNAFHLKKELDSDIILKVLQKKTNLLTTMAEQLKYLMDWVGWDEEKKDGIRARFAHPVETGNIFKIRDQIANLISEVEQGPTE